MGRREFRWLGLALGVALLVVGTHLIWSCGGALGRSSVAMVTYAWMGRQGPHGPDITVDLYAPGTSRERAPLVVLLQGNEPSQPDERQDRKSVV